MCNFYVWSKGVPKLKKREKVAVNWKVRQEIVRVYMIAESLNFSLRPLLPTELAFNATGEEDMIRSFFQLNCASFQNLSVCC